MDLASIVGLFFGFFMLLLAFYEEGGNLGSLVQVTAAMIVFGGTIGAVIVSFPLSDIKKIPKLLKLVFLEKSYKEEALVTDIVGFAEKVRREGILTMEKDIANVQNNLMKKGLRLIVDGTESETIRDILEREIVLIEDDFHSCAQIFETAGGYSPTMGIIGTVMGLISVLGQLSTPEKLGPSIALAFVATLYGVCFANLVWLPFATKVKVKGKKEKMVGEMIVIGLIALQEGQNPRIIKDRLTLQPITDIPTTEAGAG